MPKIQEEAWIVDHEQVARQTYRLRLKAPQIAARANAGQFTMLRVGVGFDPLLRRPFSFHRISPQEGMIDILYRVVGRGTWQLTQCRVGTAVNLIGPLGNAFEVPTADISRIVLIAGGIGIAPLYALLRTIITRRPEADVHLFYGARTAAELLPASVFVDCPISIHWSTDDGSYGYCGRVPQLFAEHAESALSRPAMVYSCGPLVMQYHVARWALSHGTPAQLSLESYMACGLGACLGCALPAVSADDSSAEHYVHVCKDGPIFSPGSIQWQKLQMHRPLPRTFLYS